jgi:hypothetical protein
MSFDALMGHSSPVLPSAEEAAASLHELSEATPKGDTRRKQLREALRVVDLEFHGQGRETNHTYSSSAVRVEEELEPFQVFDRDPITYHQVSTYPGRRLPHIWLTKRIPDGPLISTIDLAGKCRFTLFTGIGGEAWKSAAPKVAECLGVPFKCYSIGMYQDYEDTYFEWARLREIDENGCILVRPDRFIGWRSKGMVSDPEGSLILILRKILGRVSKPIGFL